MWLRMNSGSSTIIVNGKALATAVLSGTKLRCCLASQPGSFARDQSNHRHAKEDVVMMSRLVAGKILSPLRNRNMPIPQLCSQVKCAIGIQYFVSLGETTFNLQDVITAISREDQSNSTPETGDAGHEGIVSPFLLLIAFPWWLTLLPESPEWNLFPGSGLVPRPQCQVSRGMCRTSEN